MEKEEEEEVERFHEQQKQWQQLLGSYHKEQIVVEWLIKRLKN